MGKVSSKRRQMEIKKKWKRQRKLAKLREKYFSTKNRIEKQKILEKAIKMSPLLGIEEFLGRRR